MIIFRSYGNIGEPELKLKLTFVILFEVVIPVMAAIITKPIVATALLSMALKNIYPNA